MSSLRLLGKVWISHRMARPRVHLGSQKKMVSAVERINDILPLKRKDPWIAETYRKIVETVVKGRWTCRAGAGSVISVGSFLRWPIWEPSSSSCHQPRTGRRNIYLCKPLVPSTTNCRGPKQGILNDMAAWYLVKLVMHCHSLETILKDYESLLQDKDGTVDVMFILRGCKIWCMKWGSNHLVRLRAVGARNIGRSWHLFDAGKSTFTSRRLWVAQRSWVDTFSKSPERGNKYRLDRVKPLG